MQLPRFLLERSYTLKNILMDLEVTQVFQEDADLTNMSGTKGTRLTQVLMNQRRRAGTDEPSL